MLFWATYTYSYQKITKQWGALRWYRLTKIIWLAHGLNMKQNSSSPLIIVCSSLLIHIELHIANTFQRRSSMPGYMSLNSVLWYNQWLLRPDMFVHHTLVMGPSNVQCQHTTQLDMKAYILWGISLRIQIIHSEFLKNHQSYYTCT